VSAEIKWVVVERKNMSGRYVALRGLSFESKEAAEAHIVENYREPWRKKFHAESRAVKTDDSENRMHCQCCGRAILANLGSIAHHGYERPDLGSGWQTASCHGAKRAPFEVDRAALGEMIGYMRAQLLRNEKHRAAIKSEKRPIVFDYESHLIGPSQYQRFGRWEKWPVVKRSFDVSRKSFEEFKVGPGRDSTYGIYDFDAYKSRHVDGLSRAIKSLKEHINEEQARFESWKATHEWKDGQWVVLKKEKASA
jgi:hypothetical protein